MTIMQVGRIIATAPILFAADSSIAAAAFSRLRKNRVERAISVLVASFC
jgi:hypothetical protein